MLAELNTYWACLPAEHRWSECIDGKLCTGKQTKLAYNRNDWHIKGTQQFGGKGITSTGSSIHRNLEQGEDTRLLGLALLSWQIESDSPAFQPIIQMDQEQVVRERCMSNTYASSCTIKMTGTQESPSVKI
jgi:hypothetical protein